MMNFQRAMDCSFKSQVFGFVLQVLQVVQVVQV
jgi:hypothetical protein